LRNPFKKKKQTPTERKQSEPEFAKQMAGKLQFEKWKILRIQRPYDQLEVLIDDFDARFIDWEFIYGNGWTARVTDFIYTFEQLERKKIPTAGNIWTCECKSKYQFVHSDYIKICTRCFAILDEKEYTKRLPYIGDILKGWRRFAELPKYVK